MKVFELMEILKNCDGDEEVKLRAVTVKRVVEAKSVDIYGDEIIINS